MSGPAPTLSQVRSEAGRRGARARWGEQRRIVRLDSLPPSVAQTIRMLIAADEAARATTPDRAEAE